MAAAVPVLLKPEALYGSCGVCYGWPLLPKRDEDRYVRVEKLLFILGAWVSSSRSTKAKMKG